MCVVYDYACVLLAKERHSSRFQIIVCWLVATKEEVEVYHSRWCTSTILLQRPTEMDRCRRKGIKCIPRDSGKERTRHFGCNEQYGIEMEG